MEGEVGGDEKEEKFFLWLCLLTKSDEGSSQASGAISTNFGPFCCRLSTTAARTCLLNSSNPHFSSPPLPPPKHTCIQTLLTDILLTIFLSLSLRPVKIIVTLSISSVLNKYRFVCLLVPCTMKYYLLIPCTMKYYLLIPCTMKCCFSASLTQTASSNFFLLFSLHLYSFLIPSWLYI